MNAPIDTGLFYAFLPAPTLPLSVLADALLAAQVHREAVNAAWHDPEDDSDIAASCAVMDAECAFREALIAETGITRDKWALLGLTL